MLHEIEKILEALPAEQFNLVSIELFEKLSSCIQRSLDFFSSFIDFFSPQFQVAERALEFWKNDYFVSLTRAHSALIIKKFYPCLISSKYDH